MKEHYNKSNNRKGKYMDAIAIDRRIMTVEHNIVIRDKYMMTYRMPSMRLLP